MRLLRGAQPYTDHRRFVTVAVAELRQPAPSRVVVAGCSPRGAEVGAASLYRHADPLGIST